jgi:carbon storage regulator
VSAEPQSIFCATFVLNANFQMKFCRFSPVRVSECLHSVCVTDSFGTFRIGSKAAEATDVLVLTRKIGERILIGDKISVTIVKIGHGGVRIGVEAPPEMAVVREELAQELKLAEEALEAGQAESAME